MAYRKKYLKYKQKYLQLKNQYGGEFDGKKFEENNELCEEQKIKNKYNDCDACYYRHEHITDPAPAPPDTNLNIYRSINIDKAPSVCNNLNSVTKYFDPKHFISSDSNPPNTSNPPEYKITKWTIDPTNDPPTYSFIPVADIASHLLNVESFHGLKSYTKNSNTREYIIFKHPKEIHTLCAEGNIVWVSKESKVGSTTIDSCMFVVIILNDESKICIHHNMQDELPALAMDDKNNEVFFFNFYEQNLYCIINILNRSSVNNDNIKHIYLISPMDIQSVYVKYYNLYFKNLVLENPNKITLIQGNSEYNIIVNDNNEILNLQNIKRL